MLLDSQTELQARPELLELIDTIAKEKGISIEEIFSAMEAALNKIAHNKYGILYDIRTKINRGNGAIIVQRVFTVVEEVENNYKEIDIEEARKKRSDAVVGDEIIERLPSLEFARGGAQPFRQILMSKIKAAEKEREYQAYKDKVGEIVSGTVKRIEAGNVYLELVNKAEAYMRRDNTIPRENLDIGNRMRALIVDVRQDSKGPQILISRTKPDFIVKLFSQEIPEVYEGTIEIKAIAREAGSRTKIAVISKDQSIDPIGSCIGYKGAKIQGILGELKGEKIDLVHYSDNIANFVINAFYPVEVQKIIVNEEGQRIDVVVRKDDLSMSIGRRGQNIHLISRLVGWKIDLLSEEAEKEKRETELKEKIAYYKKAIDVDEVIARLLISEGYNSVEDIIEDADGLKEIPAFDEDIVEELTQRSKDYIIQQDIITAKALKEANVAEDLLNFNSDLSKEMLLILANSEVKTLQDLADLSYFELLDILPPGSVSQTQAEDIIMQARNELE